MYKVNRNFLAAALFIISLPFLSFQTTEFKEMKDISAFKKGLSEIAAATNTINSSFKQDKYLSILSNEIESEGVLKFKKPNLLRWEYQKPFNYGVILNGDQLIISDEGKVNSFDLTSSKAFRQINELIISSVQGDVLDEETFNISYFEGKDLYLVKLYPKEKQLQGFLQEINVYFDRSDFTVNKIKLIEPEGDYTLISFYNKKFNESIPDTAFTLK
ncbi:MAG: LolA family protein [Candidatus Cyclobacteriaceae bacterium M2_1C_046]